MPEPFTTAIITAGGAWISKDAVNKLLGPSADYFGELGRDLIKEALQNLGRVFSISCDKLRGQLDQPGKVNIRVLKGVCDEAPFSNDAFSAEYFGGLLASARSPEGKDDSAMPFINLVRSLSSFQLRLHFIAYSLFASHPAELTRTDFRQVWDRSEIHIPAHELFNAMQVVETEGQDIVILALTGLMDQGLVGSSTRYNVGGLYSSHDVANNTVIISPTPRGAQLFLRALGLRGLSPDVLSSVDIESSVSQSLRSSMRIPQKIKCITPGVESAADRFSEEIADRVEILEDECGKLLDRIEDVEREQQEK